MPRKQGFHPRQCTACSKQSGARCLRYAAKYHTVCKLHGAASLSGQEHPNYRHGRCSIAVARAVALMRLPLNVEVRVYGINEDGYPVFVPPGAMAAEEMAYVLRIARRELLRRLKEVQAMDPDELVRGQQT